MPRPHLGLAYVTNLVLDLGLAVFKVFCHSMPCHRSSTIRNVYMCPSERHKRLAFSAQQVLDLGPLCRCAFSSRPNCIDTCVGAMSLRP